MTTVYSVLKLKGQRESWWNSVRYLQTDEMSYPWTGSQESECQEKENLGYILNQTVGVLMVSLTSKGQLWKQPFSKNHLFVCLLFSHSVVSDSHDPMDCSPPGPSVHGISQARILDWVASFFFQGIFQTQGLDPCLLDLDLNFILLNPQEWLFTSLCAIILLNTSSSPQRAIWNYQTVLSHPSKTPGSICWDKPDKQHWMTGCIPELCCWWIRSDIQAPKGL